MRIIDLSVYAVKSANEMSFQDALKVLKSTVTGEQPNQAQMNSQVEARIGEILKRMVQAPVAGAVIGGLGGASIQALRRNESQEQDPKKKPSVLSGLLGGAALGGAAGGLGGLAWGATSMAMAPAHVYNKTPHGQVRPMTMTDILSALADKKEAP